MFEPNSERKIGTPRRRARATRGCIQSIDTGFLKKNLGDVKNAIYYITGPAAMVKGLHDALNASGVDDDDIRLEEFAGY
jgi:ferredoxin-NADP reductase